MSSAVQLPEPLGRGRPSKERRRRYDRELEQFAERLKRIQALQLNGRIGKRSWCYYLESDGVVDKGEFEYVSNLIDEARREGYLPLDFLADDDACSFSDELRQDTAMDPIEKAKAAAKNAVLELRNAGRNYRIGDNALWHEYAEVHPWMLVEKVDLKTEVFGPICGQYGIPIANARGQPNITTRGKLRDYFKSAVEAGCTPVLLYAGDHDPDGLHMADARAWRDKFRDLRDERWIDELRVIHVAITYDFIEEHGIDWIGNLQSSNGRERRAEDGEFVADYLDRYGRRKVEANSLVVPEYRDAAQAEFRDTIDELLGDAEERRQRDIEMGRERAEAAIENVPIERISDMVESAIEEEGR